MTNVYIFRARGQRVKTGPRINRMEERKPMKHKKKTCDVPNVIYPDPKSGAVHIIHIFRSQDSGLRAGCPQIALRSACWAARVAVDAAVCRTTRSFLWSWLVCQPRFRSRPCPRFRPRISIAEALTDCHSHANRV